MGPGTFFTVWQGSRWLADASLAYDLSNFNAPSLIRPGAANASPAAFYPQWKRNSAGRGDKRLAEFRRQAKPEDCSALWPSWLQMHAEDVNG
jgi:hypothetical protein